MEVNHRFPLFVSLKKTIYLSKCRLKQVWDCLSSRVEHPKNVGTLVWGRDTHYLHPQHELQYKRYKRYKRLGDIKSDFLQKNTSHRSNNKWGFESPQNHPNTIITVTNKKLDWDNKTETEIRTREKKQKIPDSHSKRYRCFPYKCRRIKKQHINTSTHYIAYVVGLVYGKSYRKPPFF